MWCLCPSYPSPSRLSSPFNPSLVRHRRGRLLPLPRRSPPGRNALLLLLLRGVLRIAGWNRRWRWTWLPLPTRCSAPSPPPPPPPSPPQKKKKKTIFIVLRREVAIVDSKRSWRRPLFPPRLLLRCRRCWYSAAESRWSGCRWTPRKGYFYCDRCGFAPFVPLLRPPRAVVSTRVGFQRCLPTPPLPLPPRTPTPKNKKTKRKNAPPWPRVG